jgi:hypothetical protein
MIILVHALVKSSTGNEEKCQKYIGEKQFINMDIPTRQVVIFPTKNGTKSWTPSPQSQFSDTFMNLSLTSILL